MKTVYSHVYSRAYSQDVGPRHLKQLRSLITDHQKVPWSGGSQAKEFRPEAAGRQESCLPF